MLREQLCAGKRVFGMMGRVMRSPVIAQLVKNSGLDFILYDAEHSYYNMETLHDLFLCGKALGVSSLVRVPELTKDWVSRVLDQGADGLMVPMIETKAQAEELVHWARFQPLGGRGYGSFIGHCSYQAGKIADFMQQSNDTVTVIAQIETVKGVENVDEIASVEGIDVLLVGPADLSCSYGIPGDNTNPVLLDGIAKVVEACKKHHKIFALPGPMPVLERFKEDTQMIMLSSDTNMLLAGMKGVLTDCEKIGITKEFNHGI